MGEKISIHQPNNEGKPDREVDVEHRWPIRNLGTEAKFKTRVKLVRGDKQREVQFIERHYSEADKEDAEAYIRNWNLLKEAGLPVPSVLRKTEEGDLLVSDVTVGEKMVYGKAFDLLLRTRPAIARESLTSEQIDVYKKVIDEHIDEIEDRARALAELATNKGVLLPTDDPLELVVGPNGEWKIMILDLMYARKIDESKKEDASRNARSAEVFILWLKNIRKNMESLR